MTRKLKASPITIAATLIGVYAALGACAGGDGSSDASSPDAGASHSSGGASGFGGRASSSSGASGNADAAAGVSTGGTPAAGGADAAAGVSTGGGPAQAADAGSPQGGVDSGGGGAPDALHDGSSDGPQTDAPSIDGASPTPCDSDNDCVPSGRLCDFALDLCVECLQDTTCGPNAECIEGACAPYTPCTTSLDCANEPMNTICASATDRCVECVTANDCDGDDVCWENKCVCATCTPRWGDICLGQWDAYNCDVYCESVGATCSDRGCGDGAQYYCDYDTVAPVIGCSDQLLSGPANGPMKCCCQWL